MPQRPPKKQVDQDGQRTVIRPAGPMPPVRQPSRENDATELSGVPPVDTQRSDSLLDQESERTVIRAPDLAAPAQRPRVRNDETEVVNVPSPRWEAAPDVQINLRLDPEPPQADQPQADTASQPQATLLGDYELFEELARGGMGVVYRARHTKLNRPVAVKLILAGNLAGEQEVARFYNEAESAARLQHPNIVAIYDVGMVNNQHFLSMDFVEGQSLAEVIAKGPLPPREAAEYIRLIAGAIDYAHGQGILHRDLKPPNVLIDQLGRPRVTDFGLAKRLEAESDLTVTGMLLGTPKYMSPEQASAQHARVGPASDIHALGVILFELLTGEVPFSGDSTAATLVSVIEDEAPSPRSINPAVPRDLETICLKCLVKQPAGRYASAADLATDLELYLAGEPILARSLSVPGRVMRWARQKPFLASIYGVGLLMSAFHIISMRFLRTDNVTTLDLYATGTLISMMLGATAIQRMLEIERFRALGEYLFQCLLLLVITGGFLLDRGPQSAPIVTYFLAIVSAGLLGFRTSLVWFTTLLAMILYSCLVLYAAWFLPAADLPAKDAVACMLFSLLSMGVMVHLTLRRGSAIMLQGKLSGSRSG